MTKTTEPTICRPPREAEYRRVWLEVAMRYYTSTDFMGSDPCASFIAADRFLAELKKRDGG